MHEFMAVMRGFLVGTILAMRGNRVHQKGPAELGLLQIHCSFGWKLCFHQGGRTGFGQRAHRCRRHRGRLRPHHLRQAVLRKHAVFVTLVLGIHQEVKTSVGVLELRQKIRFPFRFLENVALAVAAFGQA